MKWTKVGVYREEYERNLDWLNNNGFILTGTTRTHGKNIENWYNEEAGKTLIYYGKDLAVSSLHESLTIENEQAAAAALFMVEGEK